MGQPFLAWLIIVGNLLSACILSSWGFLSFQNNLSLIQNTCVKKLTPQHMRIYVSIRNIAGTSFDNLSNLNENL